MKNVYLETKNKKYCNGCGICAMVCPKNCISMQEDEEGFLYPVIDEERCIHCNRCKNICSNENVKEENSKTYIAINKNEEERNRSASGGMFYILANYVIKNNGVVFGVKYDENLKVVHDYAQTIEDCKKFSGSKYVRSDTTGIYKKVEEFLKEDKIVLFTGTPCQCNALKVYLKKDYEKLILVDIICHANPSPKIFEEYKKQLEIKNESKVVDIAFRSKENGWANSTPMITFANGKKKEDRIFYTAFIAELFNRPSCHACQFATPVRVTDFTIGDLWGIDAIAPEMNDTKGVSLLAVNSKKAEQIWSIVKDNMEYKAVDTTVAFSYNHHDNVPANKNREKFFKKVNSHPDSITKYMQKYTKPSMLRRVKKKIGKWVGK